MAGRVPIRVHTIISSGVVEMVPQPCAANDQAGRFPVCLKASPHDGHENWCPFAMALQLFRGGSIYDLDRGGIVRVWLTDYSSELDDWRVICLRKESTGTPVGAELRP